VTGHATDDTQRDDTTMKRLSADSPIALLLCNGEPPRRALARRVARSCDILVAADGGANSAPALGLFPDVIIGDLDSVKPSTLRLFADAEVVHVRRQDTTDMEKALDHLRAGNVRRVILLGATGRRIDMTMANLTVLWRYVPAMEITIAGDGWYAVPVQGYRRMHARVGTTLSILPYGTCRGVTLRGLRYSLTNASLGIGEVAVSNVVNRERIGITIGRGRALVVVMAQLSPDHI
jgi:thiamine pyrophosphokinase